MRENVGELLYHRAEAREVGREDHPSTALFAIAFSAIWHTPQSGCCSLLFYLVFAFIPHLFMYVL